MIHGLKASIMHRHGVIKLARIWYLGNFFTKSRKRGARRKSETSKVLLYGLRVLPAAVYDIDISRWNLLWTTDCAAACLRAACPRNFSDAFSCRSALCVSSSNLLSSCTLSHDLARAYIRFSRNLSAQNRSLSTTGWTSLSAVRKRKEWKGQSSS